MPVRLPVAKSDVELLAQLNEPNCLQVLGPALDLDVSAHDELAQVAALSFTSVAATSEAIRIEYKLRWQAFHACDGQTVSGESARVLRGSRDGADWVFECHTPLPARDTGDEL